MRVLFTALAAFVSAAACAAVVSPTLPAAEWPDHEAATNAVKHAHAKAIRVTFGNSVLEVSNDGAAPHLPLVEGTGLTTLRSRAEALGGSVEASVEDGVFTLFVTAGQ